MLFEILYLMFYKQKLNYELSDFNSKYLLETFQEDGLLKIFN